MLIESIKELELYHTTYFFKTVLLIKQGIYVHIYTTMRRRQRKDIEILRMIWIRTTYKRHYLYCRLLWVQSPLPSSHLSQPVISPLAYCFFSLCWRHSYYTVLTCLYASWHEEKGGWIQWDDRKKVWSSLNFPHIWEKIFLRIFSYIRKPFVTYDFASDPFWISLYRRKFFYSFLTVYHSLHDWFSPETHIFCFYRCSCVGWRGGDMKIILCNGWEHYVPYRCL
jgi:hypothetical protein